MNQNNNYNFNPLTGQPIQQPEQTINYQQEQQPIQSVPPKNNKNKTIIIAIFMVAIVIAGIINSIDKPEETIEKENQEIDNDNTSSDDNNDNNELTEEDNVLDDYLDEEYDESGAFLMTIEDVFTITGRGTVVTGKIKRGKVEIGDTIQIIGLGKETLTTKVEDIEMFRQSLGIAFAGDNVGILLKDIERDDVEIGQVLAETDSIISSTKFDADIYVFKKEEGGRHTPFFNKYKASFYFGTTYITGTVEFPDDVEMASPGDNVSITATLTLDVAMEVGTEFVITEGSKTVAKGTVTKIY